MKSLFWKEMREKWHWQVLLIMFPFVYVIFGGTLTFAGDFGNSSIFLITFSMVAGFFLWRYELEKEVAGFLYSRPISWLQVVFVKAATILVMVMIASVIAAILYNLFGPEQYRNAVEARPIPVGIVLLMILFFVGIVYGAAFFVGGGSRIGIAFTAYAIFVALLGGGIAFEKEWLVLAVLVYPVIGLVLMLRRHMTQNRAARQKRYAQVMAACLLTGAALHVLQIPSPSFIRDTFIQKTPQMAVLSRDAEAVFLTVEYQLIPTDKNTDHTFNRWHLRNMAAVGRVYQLQTSDEKGFHLAKQMAWTPILVEPPAGRGKDLERLVWERQKSVVAGLQGVPDVMTIHGFSPEGLIVSPRSYGSFVDEEWESIYESILIYPLKENEQIQKISVSSRAILAQGKLSPEGNYLALFVKMQKPGESSLEVVDLQKRVQLPFWKVGVTYFWWQSESSVGVLTENGERHIFDLKGLN